MEMAIGENGEERPYLFATSKVPRFIGAQLHPNCGIKAIEESPYYWWYRYLQQGGRSRAASNGLVMERPNALGTAISLCYPGGMNFEEWWNLHVHLFAEPEGIKTVRVANEAHELANIEDRTQVNLVIPLDWPLSAIINLAKSVIKEEQESRAIECPKVFAPVRSNAVYRLSEKWNVNGLANSFKVLTIKNDFDDFLQRGDKITWLEVGLKAKLSASRNMQQGERDHLDSLRRKSLEDVTRRLYSKGTLYLKNSYSHQFP